MNRLLLIAAFFIAATIASADTPGATHQQTRKIGGSKATQCQSLSHFCLNAAGEVVYRGAAMWGKVAAAVEAAMNLPGGTLVPKARGTEFG